MWFFSKKLTIGESGLLDGFVDWHSHLLPGVDDGVEDPDESVEILELMHSVGTRHVVLTPHVMEDIPNDTHALREQFDAFIGRRMRNTPSLSLAAENMLDNLFLARQKENDLLPLCSDRLLVETSYFNPPMDLIGVLGSIASCGYFPILAHPERYRYMSEHDYTRLKSMGVLFQLNLSAIFGAYGQEAHVKSLMLLDKGCYDMVGLDIHRLGQYDHFIKIELHKKLLRQLQPLIEKSNSQL